MMRNIIRNWTACIGMVVTLAACDDYLDITPKGKALLKSTEDYLGLIEDRSPEYDMMNSWILAGEASWYKAEELKSYTNPLNSVAYFWDESYDRAGDMIENAAYQSLESYSRRNKSTQSFMIPVITMIHASLQAEQTCSACNIFL